MGRALERMAELQYNMAMVAQRRRGAISSVTDLGELAVRLGSIVSFDRRGDVVWLDDFEDNINKWILVATGAGAISLSTTAANSGAKSCEVVVDAAAGAYTQAHHYRGLHALSSYGLEAVFIPPMLTDYIFELSIDTWTTDPLRIGRLRYVSASEELEYLDEDGNWQAFASGVKIYSSFATYNHMKLVVDPATGYYVRAMLNQSSYDLSDYLLRRTTYVGAPRMRVYFAYTAPDAGGLTAYVDDVIVTQNEPAND